MTQKVRIAILGASGYTGAELLRLLAGHDHASVVALTGESSAGKSFMEVYPHFAAMDLPALTTIAEVDWSGVDAVFCCLPHGTTQEVIAGLPEHVRIVDLSADFRLSDTELYAEWYGHAHRASALQKEAVYGLTEHTRDRVKKARLVANPGCYPTAAQLPLIPLIQKGIISTRGIVIDAKSGVTGAGRAAKQANLFTELDGGLSAYGVGCHRHTPEIEQGLSGAAGSDVAVRFTPHLIPMSRGILATIYVDLANGKSAADIRNTLEKAYAGEAFVHVLSPEIRPSTHQVRGSNHCFINVYEDRVPGKAIIVSVIDNLVKGASGQALQNFNLMFGFDETHALDQCALFP